MAAIYRFRPVERLVRVEPWVDAFLLEIGQEDHVPGVTG
jgi:hypothetical protein